jgi:hypothetical protein
MGKRGKLKNTSATTGIIAQELSRVKCQEGKHPWMYKLTGYNRKRGDKI